MEEDSKANSDNEQLTVIASVAVTVPSQTTANDRGTSSHKANNTELSSTSEKNASEIYESSDTTIQSDQENVTHKMAADETKSFPPDQTLQQLLKAHSERTTTSAHVEVELNRGSAIVTNSSSPGSELLEVKNSNAPGPSSKISHTISPLDATISTATNQLHIENPETEVIAENEATSSASIRSISSLVCRICHNSENPERLVSPCFCKGSLTYVHIHCLERWISTSRSTTCELCQFQYNTEQTLRYTCFQSLRMWYSRSMSRRALQEDCQMFSLLTLVAFGIIGTLLVGIQYYFLQGRTWGLSRIWTKGWLIFFLFTTLAVYFINIYMIVRSQLAPWYRWWQSARDIKLILENRKPFHLRANKRNTGRQSIEQQSLSGILPTNSPMSQQQQQQQQRQNHQSEQNLMDPQSQFQPPQVKPTTAEMVLPNIVIPLSSEHAQASNLSVRVLQSLETNAYKIPISTKRPSTKTVKTAPTIELPFQGFVY